MEWGGRDSVPQSTEAKKILQALLAPKLVVPHCSPLVWVGDPEEGGGSGPTRETPGGLGGPHHPSAGMRMCSTWLHPTRAVELQFVFGAR